MKKESFLLPLGMCLAGNLIIIFGIANSQDIAIQLSRPDGSTSWNTPESTINAVQYGFYSVGGVLVLLSIIFSAITFSHWIKKR